MLGRMCASVALAMLPRGQGIPHAQSIFQTANPTRGQAFARWLACPTYREIQPFSCRLKYQRTTYSAANKRPIIRYAMSPLYSVQVAGDAHSAVMSAMAPLAPKKMHQTCVTRRV